jgi:hypothetical protein
VINRDRDVFHIWNVNIVIRLPLHGPATPETARGATQATNERTRSVAAKHLCAESGIVVVSYEDTAEGTMIETADGGRFTNVTLHPAVKVTASAERAQALHKRAHELLNPMYIPEPLPERLFSLEISQAPWLVRFPAFAYFRQQ